MRINVKMAMAAADSLTLQMVVEYEKTCDANKAHGIHVLQAVAGRMCTVVVCRPRGPRVSGQGCLAPIGYYTEPGTRFEGFPRCWGLGVIRECSDTSEGSFLRSLIPLIWL